MIRQIFRGNELFGVMGEWPCPVLDPPDAHIILYAFYKP